MESINKQNQPETDRNIMEQHLALLLRISYIYLSLLTGGQDTLKRFLFCCAEKLYKSTIGLQRLYPLLYEQQEIEFSMGIILRSLLMDSLLTQYLRFFTLQVTEENFDEIVRQLQTESLKLIADGTSQIIQDFLASDKVSANERKQLVNNLAAIFPGVFSTDPKTGLPKIDKDYRISLAELHKKGKHQNQHSKQNVYELYAFYSKYDHVSHWTSILGSISWEQRLFKLHSSIVMIVFNLRDLLVIGQFHPDVRIAMPGLLQQLDEHMNSLYVEK